MALLITQFTRPRTLSLKFNLVQRHVFVHVFVPNKRGIQISG